MVIRAHLWHGYDLIYGFDDMGGSLQKNIPKIVNFKVYSDKIQIEFQKLKNRKLFQKIVLMIKVLFWMFGL